MALGTYTPDENKIVHTTGVDFNNRLKFFKPVHVVQYDDKLPILAISLFNNGEEYALPADAEANIRVGKPGRKFVERAALGCSEDRKTLYFEITIQMVTDWGKLYPIITIVVGDAVAGSSPILLVVEKNPIQEGDIESTNDFKALTGYVEDAKQYAESAKKSEQTSTQNAEATEEAKTQSKTNADNAKSYSESAQQSARDAAASAESIKGSEETVTQLRTETEEWAKKAESFAHGETDIRPEEATDNAKYYKEQAQAIANSITNVLRPKGNIEFAQLKLLESPAVGDFYNVTDEFTSDETFLDGPDIHYPEGSDVYWTDTNKWNVVQGSGVSGIKGKAESVYRKGQVEISKDDIGLDQVDNTPDAKKEVASAGKVTNKLTVGTKSYDGSEAVEIVKDDFGLSNVENKSAKTILGEMDKQNVVDALGYEPPVDDTQGVNLVLDSNRIIENSSYGIAKYSLSEPLELEKTYTLTIWGELDEQKEKFDVYTNYSMYRLGNISKINTGVYRASFKVLERHFSNQDDLKIIKIYAFPDRVTGPSRIDRIKVERGTVTDPVWTPAPEDIATKVPDDIFAALDPLPEAHRNNFRGKNLGTVFTDEQKAAIKAGTFHDLWVGDYWIINNHTWRIVDINYWYNKGDTNCMTPHIVVMPDAILYTHNMNASNVTDKGYQGSLMYTEGLDQAKTIVNTDFGEAYVLNHRILLTNASASGHASGGGWANSTVEIPNEIMMYGCPVFTAMNVGTSVPYLYTTESTQLALFRLVPRFINASRQWFWLRDIVLGASFADVSGGGDTGCSGASNVGGVRPVVGITGGN